MRAIVYSEYIYRYLDADLTEVEQAVLFDALAKDYALQLELQQAILINNASRAEALAIEIPAFLTSRVMVAAGVTSSSATVTVAHQTQRFNRLLTHAGALLAGFAVMFILGEFRGLEEDHSVVPPHEPHRSIGSSKEVPGANATELVASYTKSLSQRSLANELELGIRTKGSDLSDLSGDLGPAEVAKEASGNVDQDQGGSLTDNSESNSEVGGNVISEVAVVHVRLEDMAEEAPANLVRPAVPVISETSHESIFGIGIQKLALISLHADREAASAGLDNIALYVSYDLSPNERISAELGSEPLPVYVLRDDGSIGVRKSIRWAGLSYTRFLTLDEVARWQLVAKGLIGGATSGPVIKISGGLQFRITHSVAVHTMLDLTQYTLQNEGDAFSLRQVSISTGMHYHF